MFIKQWITLLCLIVGGYFTNFAKKSTEQAARAWSPLFVLVGGVGEKRNYGEKIFAKISRENF